MLKKNSLFEIFFASLKLGLTSFGGPVAHLAYFKDEYVDNRKWVDDKTYADIIALSQVLPGPGSSQVGIAIGMLRGGLLGGVVSWFAFTVPSVIVLMLFAYLFQTYTMGDMTWIASLKVVAVAIVAHAVLGLGKKLTPDKPRLAMALLAALIMLTFTSTMVQIGIIIVAGIIGFFFFSGKVNPNIKPITVEFSKKHGLFALGLFVLLLIGLPVISSLTGNESVSLVDTFYRVGSLVFGGGHVVLPLLEQELVPTGLLSNDEFLAGYGMAQAVPGPLFTFASYLGTMISGMSGALLATIAIFLPSFLLIIGALPFLGELQKQPRFQGILMGINASVVGILLAAFYNPVFTSAIQSGKDFGLAVILFALLYFWKKPAWMVVMIGVILGQVFALI